MRSRGQTGAQCVNDQAEVCGKVTPSAAQAIFSDNLHRNDSIWCIARKVPHLISSGARQLDWRIDISQIKPAAGERHKTWGTLGNAQILPASCLQS